MKFGLLRMYWNQCHAPSSFPLIHGIRSVYDRVSGLIPLKTTYKAFIQREHGLQDSSIPHEQTVSTACMFKAVRMLALKEEKVAKANATNLA